MTAVALARSAWLAMRTGGVPVYVNTALSPGPLEPEGFSGGRNESARRRNRSRVAQTIYLTRDEIHCSPEGFEMLTDTMKAERQ